MNTAPAEIAASVSAPPVISVCGSPPASSKKTR